jgi:hypothetical protein
MVLYILTFTFLTAGGTAKDSELNGSKQFSLLLISSRMQFWSVSVVTRYLNFATS